MSRIDRRSLAVIAAAGVALAAVGTALVGADGARAQGRAPFGDTDGDGLVTRAEAEAALDRRFAELDTNGDGAISRDEVEAQREMRRMERRERLEARATERFDEADADGDGALSLAELQARRPELTQERFEAMDSNADGLITADEMPGRDRMRWRGRRDGGFRRGGDEF